MEPLQKMFDKYVNKTIEFRRTKCRELVPTSQLNAVISLCMLLDTFATPEFGVCWIIYIMNIIKYLSIQCKWRHVQYIHV